MKSALCVNREGSSHGWSRGMGVVLVLAGAIAQAEVKAPARPVRVACVGDSITMGVGTLDPASQGYPARLQAMLGPTWAVTNLGVGGRTLLRKADPFAFGRSLKSEPDVVLLMLGVNDSKTNCWAQHKGDFVKDYVDAVRAFQGLPTKPRVYACLPTPTFPGNWGISGAIIADEIVPAIRLAAQETGVTVIDTHEPLLDAKALFPDKVHPNAEGARRIAELVAAQLLKDSSAGLLPAPSQDQTTGATP